MLMSRPSAVAALEPPATPRDHSGVAGSAGAAGVTRGLDGAQPAGTPGAAGERTASILIVEDERIVAMDLRVRLTRMGYTVTGIAGTAEEALARVANAPPDLVLLDICLAGSARDGISIAEELRAGPGLPFIYMTAYSDARTVDRAKTTAPFGFILKPFDERELRATIEMALYKSNVERKLRESQEWLQTTLASVGDGVIATDARGLVRFINPVAAALTGWTPEDAAGRPIDDVVHLRHEEPALARANPIWTAIEENRAVHLQTGVVLTSRDGRETPIEDSAAPIRGHSSRPSGAVFVLRDVTERRRLEAQLAQAQKMEALGRLAGGIAHDFNNMMTVVIGYGDLLMDGMAQDHPHRESIEQMRHAAANAAALTQQLLAFSRKQVLRPKIVDLNALLSSLSGMLRRVMREDIVIDSVLVPALGRVKVDPIQMEQVILNLAANARDAMPTGGRLTLSTEDVVLDDAAVIDHPDVRPGPYVCLAIRDSGKGMDRQTMARLFEPFFTTKAAGHGTGLGLSIVYGIVKQSGGHIAVASEPDRGTTFRVYLPRVEEALHPPLQVAGAPRVDAPSGGETILVVDDNDSVRTLVCAVLAPRGYRVLAAGGPAEALALARSHAGPIELMISDVIMPEISGPALAEKLRVFRPETRVLFISGYSEAAIARQGVLASNALLLQKPFTPADLARKVRGTLA